MMRRALMHEEMIEQPPQRKSLFRTRCKSKGNVCNAIIDSGSTNNLVLEEMVTKLNLRRLKHPNPYGIA